MPGPAPAGSSPSASPSPRTSLQPRPYSGLQPETVEPHSDTGHTQSMLRVPSAMNRHSVATSTATSHSSESDDINQDVITQVPQNGPMMSMGMSDPELEQEMFAEEQRLIQQGGTGIPVDENGQPCPLLAQVSALDASRKCLVLDLDETLVVATGHRALVAPGREQGEHLGVRGEAAGPADVDSQSFLV